MPITVAMFVIILVVSLGITALFAFNAKTTSGVYAAAGKRDGCSQTGGLTAVQNGFAPDLQGRRSIVTSPVSPSSALFRYEREGSRWKRSTCS